ncbi:MAG: phage portal protein [Acetatifactor sp.]
MPVELLEACIEQHLKEIPRLQKLDDYFDGEHDILKRVLDDSLPNVKIVANHAEYITTIAVGYVHGARVVYSGENATMLEQLYEKIEESSHNAELGTDVSVFGRGYELVFMSDDKIPYPELAVLSPYSTNVVCDTTVKHKSMFGFCFVPELDIKDKVTGYVVNVYCKGFIDTYRCSNLRSADTYVFIGREESFFGKVQITEYKNNKKGKGDYEGVIPLIDAYNLLQSDRLNDKEQLADALLAIENGSLGDDVAERSETAEFIKKEKILELDQGGKAYWVVKTLNETQIEVLKKSLKDDIHEFSKVPCLTDENFVGNSSGVAMKYKLLGLEDLGKTKERYFKRGLKRRLKLLENIFYIQALPFQADTISIAMKRTLPVDDETQAKIAQDTEGLVSWETRVKRFDPDIDVEDERRKLADENTAQLQRKSSAFGSYDFGSGG